MPKPDISPVRGAAQLAVDGVAADDTLAAVPARKRGGRATAVTGQTGETDVLVTGATGFIGKRLCSALSDAGHTVAAMTRHPHDDRGAGSPVYGDIDDSASLVNAVADCEVAYYLVPFVGPTRLR